MRLSPDSQSGSYLDEKTTFIIAGGLFPEAAAIQKSAFIRILRVNPRFAAYLKKHPSKNPKCDVHSDKHLRARHTTPARYITRRNPMRKRATFSFIFNGELTHKLVRAAVAGLLGIIFVCGGISGCDNGEDIVTPTETETEGVETTVPVISDYDGDSIYFKQGGTIYEGRVVEGVSADEVLVRFADGSEMVVDVDLIAGTWITRHPDVGTKVVMLGERAGESTLDGEVVKVFSDGVRKIKIVIVTFVNKRFEWLEVPRIRYSLEAQDKDDFLKGGGYLPAEEFAEWID